MVPPRSLLVVLLLVCVLAGNALAGSRVRIATPVGDLDLELYDQQRPITVQNFLSYVKKGRYRNGFSHRLIPNFVLQGGGWYLQTIGTGNTLERVLTDAPIKNEFARAPAYSNVKGTITMAKVANNPDSATSQWFINLKDNNSGSADSGNLDLQNGGFTVFGRVVAGKSVLNALNADFTDANTAVRGIFNVSGTLGSDFTNLPLLRNSLTVDNLLSTTVTIVSEELPTLRPKARQLRTKKSSLTLEDTVTAGVDTLEWRLGTNGRFRQQATGRNWQLRVTGLKRGPNFISVRAITISGGRGVLQKIRVIRQK